LPDGIVAQSNILVSVEVSNPDVRPFNSKIDEETIVIQKGVSQADYELSFREPNPAIDFEFSVSCVFNCKQADRETSSTFFLQNNGTFKSTADRIRAISLPQVIDFQYPALPVFNAAIITPSILLLMSDEASD